MIHYLDSGTLNSLDPGSLVLPSARWQLGNDRFAAPAKGLSLTPHIRVRGTQCCFLAARDAGRFIFLLLGEALTSAIFSSVLPLVF